jgi:hypothetical protein
VAGGQSITISVDTSTFIVALGSVMTPVVERNHTGSTSGIRPYYDARTFFKGVRACAGATSRAATSL